MTVMATQHGTSFSGTPRFNLREQATVALENRAVIEQLVDELMSSFLALPDDWLALSDQARENILSAFDQNDLVDRMTRHGLLTEYQCSRIKASTIYGLVLGNYRVLDRVGAGGMGIVFKAEHVLLRRTVAIKVLPLSRDQDPRVLQRFRAEMRAIAALQHPNIVAAMDAAEVHPTEPDLPVLHYLVMEYVDGRDLDDMVTQDGPLPIDLACDLIYQIAGALSEANSHDLVHRDIKPSNILVNAQQQAKLLDFGLARDFAQQLTEQGSLLGTLDYMAPEQAQDPHSVDIRADIYGLGATLYWCLTGTTPFPPQNSITQQIARRLREPPPSSRLRRPEIPAELDQFVLKMMAVRADDRFQTPQAVMRGLLPFLRNERAAAATGNVPAADTVWSLAEAEQQQISAHRILIVDDEPSVAGYARALLEDEQTTCDVVIDGEQALAALSHSVFDLVLLDVVLPGLTGFDVLLKMRESPACKNVRVVMMSGGVSPDDLAQMLSLGADDFIAKPFGAFQLRARVQSALRHSAALRRIEVLAAHAQALTHDLERQVEGRQVESRQYRQALVQGLVAVIRQRAAQTPSHLLRVQHHCRALAEAAVQLPAFADQIDRGFVQSLEYFAPLYDLGLVALPDHLLRKSGLMELEERLIYQTHATLGSEIIEKVADAMGPAGDFLALARQIVRHHHEQYNGKGYPDRLAAEDIPLAARIIAIVDTYDMLRSRRQFQSGLPHSAACEVVLEASPGKFDPNLLIAFKACAARFDEIFQQIPD